MKIRGKSGVVSGGRSLDPNMLGEGGYRYLRVKTLRSESDCRQQWHHAIRTLDICAPSPVEMDHSCPFRHRVLKYWTAGKMGARKSSGETDRHDSLMLYCRRGR